jgi:Putative zincin peptidase
MFFIPGQLIAIATFPGVIVHEFAHMFFCRLRGVAVFEVCYFQVANPAGYVIHAKSDNFYSTFLISMGPFLVNTILCFLICLPAYIPIFYFDLAHPLSYALMWLGVSIGMHAIPSTQDAKNIWDEAKIHVRSFNVLAIVTFPLVVVLYVFNVLRAVWADLAYGILIGYWLPSLIFK